MSVLSLVAFERETIRIAADEVVVQLRSRPPVFTRKENKAVNGPEEVATSASLASTSATSRDESGFLVINEQEAAALETLNDSRKGFCSRSGSTVALSKHCGVVRLGSAPDLAVTLEILPKLWTAEAGADGAAVVQNGAIMLPARRALLRMLASATGLSISEHDVTPQAVADGTLLDHFIRSFLRACLKVAKQGLLTRYVETVDDLPTLRGKYLFADSASLSAVRPAKFRCRFDELTIDNPYNQALFAAIDICRSRISQTSTQRLWYEARGMFGKMSFVRMSARQIALLKRSRETARYEDALSWAKILLDLLAPSLSGGESPAPALLFNMEVLFEHWVECHERTRAPDTMVVGFKGAVRELAMIDRRANSQGRSERDGKRQEAAFDLKPDLQLWRAGDDIATSCPVAIIDAKWKLLNPARTDWGVEEKDIYQILAYLTRYGCRTARLAYPALSLGAWPEPPTFTIAMPGGGPATISVELVPIDV